MSELPEDNKKYTYLALGQQPLPEQHIMTVEELNNIVEYLAQGALRCKKAGIDCIVGILRDYGYVDACGMGVRTKVISLMRARNNTEPVFEATADYIKTSLFRKK
jgi:hypothetical protein